MLRPGFPDKALNIIPFSGLMQSMRSGELIAKRCAVVGGILLVAALGGLLLWSPREPVYEEKPISYWLSAVATAPPENLSKDPNAIRFLIKALNRDSWIGASVYRKQVWPKLPRVIRGLLPGPTNRVAERTMAAVCLRKMGPMAEPAIPALARVLKEDEDFGVRCNAVWALAAIGKGHSTAISTLVSAQADKDEHVVNAAAAALLDFGPEAAAKAVPRDREGIPGFGVSGARIEADRNWVATETLNESMLNLISNNQQYSLSRGALGHLGRLFISARALKVIQTVEDLRAPEQEPACRNLFVQAFSAHTNELSGELSSRQAALWQSSISTGMSVCVAMFTAADLGLRGLLAEEFAQLDPIQDRVAASNMRRMEGNGFAVPDEHFQLNVLRLVALRDPSFERRRLSLLESELATNAVQTISRTVKLTNWVAVEQRSALFTRQAPPVLVSNQLAQTEVFKRYDFLYWKDSDPFTNQRQEPARRQLVGKIRGIVFAP